MLKNVGCRMDVFVDPCCLAAWWFFTHRPDVMVSWDPCCSSLSQFSHNHGRLCLLLVLRHLRSLRTSRICLEKPLRSKTKTSPANQRPPLPNDASEHLTTQRLGLELVAIFFEVAQASKPSKTTGHRPSGEVPRRWFFCV